MKLIKTGAVFLLVAVLLMTGMPAAFADSSPTLQTLKPTKMYLEYRGGIIGGTDRYDYEDVRARLNGSVNPGGDDCTVYFEYGTTTAYGSTAPAGTVSGTSAVSVSADLTGLRPNNTLYHYRLVAVTDSGIYYGQDVAFYPRCDSGEVYWGYHEMDFLSQLLPASDPTGNIQIVATSSDSPAMANFDIYNHNNFDVFLNYDAGVTATGAVAIGQQQNAQIFVPKGSVCAFSYNYSPFKQIVTNDQYNYETPLPQNKIELYSLGYLTRGYYSTDYEADVYSINNRNGYDVTLNLQSGSASYNVTVPANANVYFVWASPGAAELMASYGGNPFVVVSQSAVKWYGAALVTAEPQGYSDTTATFRLQNNDDTAHSVKLKNAGGVTHEYTLAPYEHQTVTIEKSDWDLYMQLSPLPQPNIAGWVEDGYVKINSVSPGDAVLPPLSVSNSTVFMGAYGESVTLVYVTGGGAWTAISDQPWLTVSPVAGSGFGWLTMTASANTLSSSRSAVVTVSDGTTTKAVTVTQTAQGRGNALSFDGADDYVSVPDNDNGITDAFTLESWVKWEPGAPTDIQFICGKNTEQMELQAGGSANSLRFIPTPGVYLDAAGVLPTGVWTHVAVIYRPSAGMTKMYINGSEVTLANHGSQPLTAAVGNTDTSFFLGSRSDGTYRFKGALDDFRIWNRALTQNEIRQNMLNPIDPSGQTGLVSAYSFNQGVAGGDNAGVTALVDETGYRNGSLSGFALSGPASNWVVSGAGEGFHTVTVSAGPAEGGSASGGGVYSEGSSVTVTATASSGYTFVNWTEGGSPVSTDAAYTFTLDTTNRTLVANFIVTPPVITTGTISGMVTDGTNPVSGADVSLTVSGSVYSATTAANGSYSILNIPAGTGYTVTATKSGYTSGSATNVSVTANTTTQNINITLTAAVSTAVTLLSVTADGVSDTTTSTKIDLTFDTAIDGLTASDITVTDGSGAAVKGALSGSGTSWSIALTSVATQGDVTVAVAAPAGYTISGSPKTVAVYKAVAPTAVTLQTAVADGVSDTTTSTKIDLTFDTAIAGLTASDITVTDGSGVAVKGALTGSGTSWSIALASVTTQGNVSVAVAAPSGYSISGSPKTVAVYKAVVPTPVTLQVAVADGVADTTTSTKIDLTFDTAIAGLTASDITISDGTGSAIKGALTGGGTSWSIAISNVSEGTVNVAVASPAGYGVSGSPKTVNVYAALTPPTPVTLQTAVADGASGTTTSTKIDLTFDTVITGLTADDITITNGSGAAVKGALSGGGTSWSIALTSVTTQGDVTVAVSAPAGYTISGSPKTVAVYKAVVPTAVTLQSATADGAADTTTSTKIDLTFDTAIAGLTASDITITNGTGAAVKGTLSGSGTSWSIALTSVTTQGNVSVAVTAPSGYSISGSPKTVAVYKAIVPTAVTLLSATADGVSDTTTSTKIDLTFDTAIAGLTASDITITNGSGAAVKGALTGSGTNWSIALTSVATQGNVTVAVAAPAGYTISGSPKTVAVYKAVTPTAVTLQTAVADGVADTTTSTKIDFTFDTAIAGLTASDITITNGTGAAVKGVLTGSGTNWSIALTSVTTQGNVSVTVAAPAGYSISGSPKTVAVYKAVAPTAVMLQSATADGVADTTTSTKIDLTFDTAIAGLTASDITIASGSGSATKGVLTGSGTSWSIAISNVTEGMVSVAVGSPTGYSVSGSPKMVNVYAANSTDKNLVSVTTPAAITGVANGTSKTASALGLPEKVTLVTSGGNVSASVSWDVASSSYNVSSGSAQAFTVNGTVTLPAGVINPDNVPLSTSISVTVNAGSTGGGNNGGGGGGAPSTPEYKADVETGNGSNTTLPVTVDKNSGSASVEVGTGSDLLSGGKTTVVTIPSVPDIDTYALGVPVPNLTTPDEQGEIAFKTDNGSVTVPSNMLTGIEGISRSKAQISIGQGDKSTLPESVKSAIGDKPLIQLTLSIDGKQTDWSNPDAAVTVSIPYTPTAEELKNPESIVIWYIDGSGKAVSVPNGRYDPATGTVTFFTTHFSNYAVTYVNKTFSDLDNVEWARKAIEVMAAKGITSGTGDGTTFSPTANVTRADYIVLLVKTLGLTVSFDDNFDDVQPGTYYYDATGVAKKLGITAGSGNNLFKPTENISRQDMMVLTARALEKYQGLKAADDNGALDRFNDKSSIADYALNSLATLVSEGLIEGSGNNINPRSYTTRAETAVFLYKIYDKYPDAPVFTESVLSRLAGQNKVDTALSVARAAYPNKITNAVLATADYYPDALSGSVLAYQLDAPILLVGSSEADQKKVLDYLQSSMAPDGTVYILGGTSVVSGGMENEIRNSGFKHIARVAGETRYDTSAKIAEQLNVKTGTPVVLVSGENYPDALSVSSVTAQNQYPILLVEKDGISDVVRQALASIKPEKIYIIGLEGAIRPVVESQVAKLTSLKAEDIVRIGGADRYATSLAVAEYFNLGSQTICIATGNYFPDALAGSIYAAKNKAPIILTDSILPAQTVDYIVSRKPSRTVIFGGEAAVGGNIERLLKELAEI